MEELQIITQEPKVFKYYAPCYDIKVLDHHDPTKVLDLS